MIFVLLACVQGEMAEYTPLPEDTSWACIAKRSDEDCDGWGPSTGDCDEGDPLINPEAEEVCDGIDNNCNDEVDEQGMAVSYVDADGDGHCSTETALQSCYEPCTVADDCDDTRADVYPGALEECDGADEDCDGVIDEECAE